MKCKFPNKECSNRYLRKGAVLICRLPEWKSKKGSCPYCPEIKAHAALKQKEIIAGQKTLFTFEKFEIIRDWPLDTWAVHETERAGVCKHCNREFKYKSDNPELSIGMCYCCHLKSERELDEGLGVENVRNSEKHFPCMEACGICHDICEDDFYKNSKENLPDEKDFSKENKEWNSIIKYIKEDEEV